MWDDSPCEEGSVQSPEHPEQAQPAEMFSSLIHLQELSVVRVHNRDWATDPAGDHQRPSFNLTIKLSTVRDVLIAVIYNWVCTNNAENSAKIISRCFQSLTRFLSRVWRRWRSRSSVRNWTGRRRCCWWPVRRANTVVCPVYQPDRPTGQRRSSSPRTLLNLNTQSHTVSYWGTITQQIIRLILRQYLKLNIKRVSS